jgi:DNA-binding beta-propeller fold protein YncE
MLSYRYAKTIGIPHHRYADPVGVCVSMAGDVYVSDMIRNRILGSHPDGSYRNQTGGIGSAPTQLLCPGDIASCKSGNLVIADTQNHRILILSAELETLLVIPCTHPVHGHPIEPNAIVATQDGTVAITSWASNLLLEYTADGALLRWLAPEFEGCVVVSEGSHLACLPGRGLLVTDSLCASVYEVDLKSCTTNFCLGGFGTADGLLLCPQGIAACQVLDRIYVVDTAGACVKVYQSDGSFLFTFGTFGNQLGQFDQPVGIAVTPSAIYVTDRGNAAVSVFNTSGEPQTYWSSKETGKGTLNRPGAISISKDGSLFVSEHQCNRVTKFHPDGSWALTWGREGRDEGEFREVGGIRVVDDGTVWVGDIYNRRAQQFNQEGEYLSQVYLPAGHPIDFLLDSQGRLLVLDGLQQIIRRFDANGNRVADLGKRGGGLGEFAGGPGSIEKDEEGRLWVVNGMPADGDQGYQGRWNVQEEEAERLTGRRKPLLIQIFDMDDTPLFALGEAGHGDGELWHPSVLRLLSNDCYLIGDPGNWRLSIYKRDGTHLYSFGSKGLRNGQIMGFAGIEVDAHGRIYVVDSVEHRIVVFEPVDVPAA